MNRPTARPTVPPKEGANSPIIDRAEARSRRHHRAYPLGIGAVAATVAGVALAYGGNGPLKPQEGIENGQVTVTRTPLSESQRKLVENSEGILNAVVFIKAGAEERSSPEILTPKENAEDNSVTEVPAGGYQVTLPVITKTEVDNDEWIGYYASKDGTTTGEQVFVWSDLTELQQDGKATITNSGSSLAQTLVFRLTTNNDGTPSFDLQNADQVVSGDTPMPIAQAIPYQMVAG